MADYNFTENCPQLFLLANLSITIKSNQLVEKSTGRLIF